VKFPPQFRALTVTPKKAGRLQVIATDCHISPAFDPRQVPEQQRPQYHQFTAIWDTGATSSVITDEVVAKCNLKPTGMTHVHSVTGEHDAETFLVNIGLPNEVAFFGVQVTRGKIGGAQVLLGMDIITHGDFSITNLDGHTVFSFRVPSIATVDFVTEAVALETKAAATKKRAAKRRQKGRRKRKRRK
jgi:hypothetical protein